MSKIKSKLNRTALVTIIATEIRRLQKRRDYDGIAAGLEAIGWVDNRTDRSIASLAESAVSLLAMTSDKDIALAAAWAVWSRDGKSESNVRADLEPLGVRFVTCGCLAFAKCDCATIAIRGTTIAGCTGSAVAL